MTATIEIAKRLPLLPLRDVVIFPRMVITLFVGREKSIEALEIAMRENKQIMLVTQKEASEDAPDRDGLYDVGCVANILRMLKLPDGNIRVLVEGVQRAKLTSVLDDGETLIAEIEPIVEVIPDQREAEILARQCIERFEKYVQLHHKIPDEILKSLPSMEDPGEVADSIAAHMQVKVEQKQQVLQCADIVERLERLAMLLETEIDLLEIEQRIRGRVKQQMEKSQREYYLNEQMKAIQKELGELDDGPNEIEEIEKKIASSGMPKEAREKVESELRKLKMMSPMSAEATVVRGYIDWMLQVPWAKRTRVKRDIAAAQKILDADHYGLEKVKERILEYLAVQSRVRKLKGPILCLVGPPGVGKTSLGQSIAKATGRKFVRMALGGVRDEAEIRGHRRTYIGALPGKIIQKLAKVGVKNPLFLLDEVDKMGMDMRGDPASALLEVLDPEQNNAFNDHYLEVDYDLSEVMFVATANSMNIPAPLLDRMEVIRLSGYTEDEKLNIAKKYLLPKQMQANGLKRSELEMTDEAIIDIIRYYTREAGVRSLERELAKICRRVVKCMALGEITSVPVVITPDKLEEYLGVRRYDFGRANDENQVGQVNGLAWTEVGGELLTIEAVTMPGKGKTTFTGHLGEVMQESIKAAMTVVRVRAEQLGIDPEFYTKTDIHVHVPEGATPKDGPSAGIGMCTALVSSLTGIPVRKDVGMTGEITLRGEVLAIGGLKEKLLAAHRAGLRTVLIPRENARDLKEIPENVKENLEIVPVKWIDEVLQLALERMPTPWKAQGAKITETEGEEKGKSGAAYPAQH
ncbi:MAG: endopeptidase La [Gammaproteobacteria bacterium]|nr:MAG: endopeptidase La [Gammaproteobacteria bacterium]